MPAPDILLGAAIGIGASAPLTLAFIWPTITATRRRQRQTQADAAREKVRADMLAADLAVEKRLHEAAMAEVARGAVEDLMRRIAA